MFNVRNQPPNQPLPWRVFPIAPPIDDSLEGDNFLSYNLLGEYDYPQFDTPATPRSILRSRSDPDALNPHRYSNILGSESQLHDGYLTPKSSSMSNLGNTSTRASSIIGVTSYDEEKSSLHDMVAPSSRPISYYLVSCSNIPKLMNKSNSSSDEAIYGANNYLMPKSTVVSIV